MKVVATKSNMARMLSRMLSIPTITATEMMAMIKPYSIAVAPVRSLRSAINFCTHKSAIPEIPLILRAGRAAVKQIAAYSNKVCKALHGEPPGCPAHEMRPYRVVQHAETVPLRLAARFCIHFLGNTH